MSAMMISLVYSFSVSIIVKPSKFELMLLLSQMCWVPNITIARCGPMPPAGRGSPVRVLIVLPLAGWAGGGGAFEGEGGHSTLEGPGGPSALKAPSHRRS